MKDYKGAIGDYNRALYLDPYMARTYSNRGNAHFFMRNKFDACADWTKAVEMGFDYAQEALDLYCKVK